MLYRPRNDYVLLRLDYLGISPAGVALPEVGDSGRRWTVVAAGPDAKGLKPGDVVMAMGTLGQDIARLPREKSLYVTKEANILLVVEPEGDGVLEEPAGLEELHT